MSDQPFHLQAPANSVICTIPTKADVDALVGSLVQVGYDSEEAVEVGHGEEWLEAIDPDGSHHGSITRLVRAFQRFTTEVDDRTLRAVEAALTSGEFIVVVSTDGSDNQRDQVHELMQDYSGTHIFFAGHTMTQLLSGW